MQVTDGHSLYAWCCDSQGARRRVDTALVGRQPEGTWLLVFMGVAREVLDAGSAALMNDALEALSRVMAGETEVDHLFPDLAGREPPLPEHLRHLVETPGAGRETGGDRGRKGRKPSPPSEPCVRFSRTRLSSR